MEVVYLFLSIPVVFMVIAAVAWIGAQPDEY